MSKCCFTWLKKNYYLALQGNICLGCSYYTIIYCFWKTTQLVSDTLVRICVSGNIKLLTRRHLAYSLVCLLLLLAAGIRFLQTCTNCCPCFVISLSTINCSSKVQCKKSCFVCPLSGSFVFPLCSFLFKVFSQH